MEELETSKIKQIEVEINFYKGQAVQSIFEIGERLIKAKELIPHGEWGQWLGEKVSFSHAQANNFMKVASEYSNSQALRNLGQTKVFAMLALPQEERETFIEEHPIEDMTTRELQRVIKENKELKELVEIEKNKPPQILKERIEVEPSDYRVLKTRVEIRDRQIDDLEKQKELLERKAALNKQDSEKYKDLKSQIENLSKQKDDLSRQIRAKTELSGLVVRVEDLLKKELAPIKYSRAIREVRTDPIVINNLREIVDRVQEWCNEMEKYTRDANIIEVEVTDYE